MTDFESASGLLAEAITDHEWYTSYIEAGFNEYQAMDLVKTRMANIAMIEMQMKIREDES